MRQSTGENGDRSVGIARRRLLRRLAGAGAAGGAAATAGCGGLLSNDGPIDCEPAERSLDPADWPLPDRDPGNTRAAPASAAPPADPVRTLDVEFPTGSPGPSPIVVGDGLFAFQISRLGREIALASVDRTDGTVRWHRTLDDPGLGEILGIGDRRFLQDNDDLSAFDAGDGDASWHAASATPVTVADGRLVTVHGDEPIVTDRATVRGRHAGSGDACWESVVELAERERRNRPWPYRPTVADGRIVLVSEAAVTALSADDGSREWQVPTEFSAGPSLAVGDSVVVYGQRELGCVALADGTERWRRPVSGRLEGIAATEEVVVTSKEFEDVVLVRGRDAADGSVLWNWRLGDVWGPFGRPLSAPTIAGDEVLVAGSTPAGDHVVVRLGLGDGTERGRIALPERAIADPVVVGGSLVVQTGARLLGFG